MVIVGSMAPGTGIILTLLEGPPEQRIPLRHLRHALHGVKLGLRSLRNIVMHRNTGDLVDFRTVFFLQSFRCPLTFEQGFAKRIAELRRIERDLVDHEVP
jgi:hypothetical protein